MWRHRATEQDMEPVKNRIKRNAITLNIYDEAPRHRIENEDGEERSSVYNDDLLKWNEKDGRMHRMRCIPKPSIYSAIPSQGNSHLALPIEHNIDKNNNNRKFISVEEVASIESERHSVPEWSAMMRQSSQHASHQSILNAISIN